MEQKPRKIKLGYTDSHSDKVHIIHLTASDDGWNVIDYYGKRWQPNNQNPLAKNVPYGLACEIIEKRLKHHLNKGYIIEEDE